jgi:hypothetical protein
MHLTWGGLLLGLSLLSACASVPTDPSVLALPATGKPLDVFQAEEEGCRVYAQQRVAAAATTSQEAYDMAYIQCMYSKGNAIPAVVAPGPHPPLPPPEAAPPPSSSPPALPPPATPPR